MLVWLLLVPTGTVLIPVAATALPSPGAAGSFDTALAAQVFATALTFMEPRTLEPVPIPELTVWGLHGLTALDPTLTPELRDGSLRLVATDRILFAQAPPPEADAMGWADAASRMAAAAWEVSDPIRRAGTGGVIQSFFDEMFNHLDPYSRYVAPQAADVEREDRAGNAGIGASFGWHRHQLIVRGVIDGSPAAQAGIEPGDRVVSIDGESTERLSLSDLQERVAGPDGSQIVVGIRDLHGRFHLLELYRAAVPPETVFSQREGDALVLRVTGFASDTAQRLDTELTTGLKRYGRQIRGVVIDLRGNRGGLLRQSVEAVNALLDNGLIVVTIGRNPQATHVWRATGSDLAEGLPMIVVVDGRTASASEIMSAALADQRRAVVVGSATLGKGLVQTIAPLPDGGELFVTWSRVLAPFGWPLQGLGVMPQLCTSLGQDAMQQQLEELQAGRQEMAVPLQRERDARAPLPAAQIVDIRNACPAAEGSEADMRAAHFLIDHPEAYATALLPRAAGDQLPH
jgi:carboxyl-terminal processing protease